MEEEALRLLRKIDEGLAIRVANEIQHDGTLDVELRMAITEAMVRSLIQEGIEGGELKRIKS